MARKFLETKLAAIRSGTYKPTGRKIYRDRKITEAVLRD